MYAWAVHAFLSRQALGGTNYLWAPQRPWWNGTEGQDGARVRESKQKGFKMFRDNGCHQPSSLLSPGFGLLYEASSGGWFSWTWGWFKVLSQQVSGSSQSTASVLGDAWGERDHSGKGSYEEALTITITAHPHIISPLPHLPAERSLEIDKRNSRVSPWIKQSTSSPYVWERKQSNKLCFKQMPLSSQAVPGKGEYTNVLTLLEE